MDGSLLRFGSVKKNRTALLCDKFIIAHRTPNVNKFPKISNLGNLPPDKIIPILPHYDPGKYIPEEAVVLRRRPLGKHGRQLV